MRRADSRCFSPSFSAVLYPRRQAESAIESTPGKLPIRRNDITGASAPTCEGGGNPDHHCFPSPVAISANGRRWIDGYIAVLAVELSNSFPDERQLEEAINLSQKIILRQPGTRINGLGPEFALL